MIRYCLFLLIFCLSSTVFAFSLESVFIALKTNTRSFEDKGAVCEEVVKLYLEQEFAPPRYEVLVGVAYGDLERVIGELDEVVVDTQTQEVVRVLEVKCWKDLRAGQEKAQQQRERFLKTLKRGAPVYFNSTQSESEYSNLKFSGQTEFLSIGQQGAVAFGFDRELPFSMLELMALRTRVLQCRSWGDCLK